MSKIKHDTTSLFYQAQDFNRSYMILDKHSDEYFNSKDERRGQIIMPALSPAVVILTFAIELYLKSILMHYNNEFTKTHHILKLFNEVPKELKNAIYRHKNFHQIWFTVGWLGYPPKTIEEYETAFDHKLEAMSNAFNDWRYIERSSMQFESAFAESFAETLNHICYLIWLGQDPKEEYIESLKNEIKI